MDLSRRSFLHAGGMLGLAALAQGALAPLARAGQKHKNRDLGSGVGFVVPKQTLNDPLYLMTRAMFTENLGHRISLPARTARAALQDPPRQKRR